MELYIKNNYTGKVHQIGTDQHDSLYVDSNGAIQYLNLQVGEGTQFSTRREGYSFCDKNGKDLRDWEEEYNYVGIGASILFSLDTFRQTTRAFAGYLAEKIDEGYIIHSDEIPDLAEQYIEEKEDTE